MTEEHFKILEDYVEKARVLLGLSNWIIKVEREPAPDHCGADVYVPIHRNYATIRVRWDFETLPEDDQVQVIIHELMHCHTDDMKETIKQIVVHSGMIASPFCDEAYTLIKAREERMVDTLALTFLWLCKDIHHLRRIGLNDLVVRKEDV